jgi:hypothetical protein
MEKFRRLILRPTKNKLVSSRSVIPGTAAAPKVAETEATDCAREVQEMTASDSGAEKRPGGPSAAAESDYETACRLGAVSQVPTGSASWRANPGSAAAQLPFQPHKRRRRGRRGRRKRKVAVGAQQVQVRPLTSSNSLGHPERPSGDESEHTGSFDGEGFTLDGIVQRKISEKTKVKAFNLTYMKHELGAMLNTLIYIDSLQELRFEGVDYLAELSKESKHFEETLRGLLDSVNRAESVQWSYLESNAAAKGRRPR